MSPDSSTTSRPRSLEPGALVYVFVGFWYGDYVSQLPYVWYYVGVKSSFQHALKECESTRVSLYFICCSVNGSVCVACLTVFVNCLMKQFAICLEVVVNLLLNVIEVFSVCGGDLLDRLGMVLHYHLTTYPSSPQSTYDMNTDCNKLTDIHQLQEN